MKRKRYLIRSYRGADGHTRTVSVREENGTYKVYRRTDRKAAKDTVIFESKNKLHLEQGDFETLPRIVETVDNRACQFKTALERLIHVDAKWAFKNWYKVNWRFLHRLLKIGNIEDYPNILKCHPYPWALEKCLILRGDISNWALLIDNEIDELEKICGDKIAASEAAVEEVLLLLED